MSDSPNDESSSAQPQVIRTRFENFDLILCNGHELTAVEFKKLQDEIRAQVELVEAELEQLNEEHREVYIDAFRKKGSLLSEARRRNLTLIRRHVDEQTRLAARASKQAEPVRLVRPPRLAFAGLARLILKPAAYRRYVEPAIADMHEEYFACLARGDERGAKIAVAKGNLYAVPGWLWALLAQLVLKLIGLIRA